MQIYLADHVNLGSYILTMIHETSAECASSATDIFSSPPTQTSIIDRKTVHVYPSPSLQDDTPIEFYVAASDESYTSLIHSLSVELSITKKDGTALGADDNVALVNFPLHALFSQIDVLINDTLVTTSANTYPYAAAIEKLLTYDTDTLHTQFSSELIALDTAGQIDALTADNKGFTKRKEYTKLSKTVELRGSLHVPILRLERLLINQCSLKIKLYPNNPKFYLMAATDDFKVKIKTARLELEKITINPDLLNDHAARLMKQNAIYPIRRGDIKTFSIPAGNSNIIKENLFVGKLPRRLVVTLVESSGFNGNSRKSPFHFWNFELTYLAAYVDGNRRPNKALEPDYENKRYMDCYHSLYDGIGMTNEDRTLAISRDDYRLGYALYIIRITPGEPNCYAYELTQKGNIRLEMKFSKPLNENVTAIIYADYDDQLEIDRDRNVLIDV